MHSHSSAAMLATLIYRPPRAARFMTLRSARLRGGLSGSCLLFHAGCFCSPPETDLIEVSREYLPWAEAE
jgi:hypothetical protein